MGGAGAPTYPRGGHGEALRLCVDVTVDGARLAETVALEFLLRGAPDAGEAAGLAAAAAAELKAARDWADGCAERRAELASRQRELDEAREGIQRLLAGGGAGKAAAVAGAAAQGCREQRRAGRATAERVGGSGPSDSECVRRCSQAVWRSSETDARSQTPTFRTVFDRRGGALCRFEPGLGGFC